MPFYRTPNLGMVHMKGSKLPAPCREQLLLDGNTVVCMFASTFLCDGPADGRRTCDRPLCSAHATQTGPNKHLCPGCRTAAADAAGQRSLFTHLVAQ